MEENPQISPGAKYLKGNRGDEVEAANSCQEQSPCRESSSSRPPEVQSIVSIVDELESRFTVGQVMKSVEDAYLLYCNYAHAKGFSVKKGDQRYFPRCSELQSKEFECSREGVTVKRKRHPNDRTEASQNPTGRTNCKARLKIVREKGGEWRVTRFVKEHNHEMVSAEEIHLLRSSRNISHAKKSAIEAMVNAGISIANVTSSMEEEVQGPQNFNFIRKDACDSPSHLRKHSKIETRDASELFKYFINKSNNEPFFFWDVQWDADYRMSNFFFRDYQCKIDYECFGDVLSVDTTYRTNKYDLICVPFVGVNQHQQNVMFGLAFMSDETEDSFEWLYRTFRRSMNGKQPETIFSDLCPSMMNAIESIFPRAHHRLCQGHINQNAQSYLGNLNDDSRFRELWNKCMKCCDSEEEFEVTWRNMVDEFNLSGHNWLNGLYKLRHKWAFAFSSKKFSAGLSTTSCSEDTSSMLEKAGDRLISLYNFILNYEKSLEIWRANEKAEDSRCCREKPPMIVKNNPLLNHAADIYTINMYSLFESELVESLSTEFTEQPSFVGPFLAPFKVKSHGGDSKVREVVFNEQKNEIKCSCHKFESMGILCKHALKVLNFVKVHSVPEHYIKTRWTKNVRNKVLHKVTGTGFGHVSEIEFVNQTVRLVYDLTMQCKPYKETRNMLTGFLNDATKKLNDWFENLSLNESSKSISKGMYWKGKLSETATNECLSQEETHTQLSQKAKNVQPSVYQVDYPMQEASIASQSSANRPWLYPMSFATMSPVTPDMHLRGQSNDSWRQHN